MLLFTAQEKFFAIAYGALVDDVTTYTFIGRQRANARFVAGGGTRSKARPRRGCPSSSPTNPATVELFVQRLSYVLLRLKRW